METGSLEIHVNQIELLNIAQQLPFSVNDPTSLANEELRYRYRYLDLRCTSLQKNLKLRGQIMKYVRDYLCNHGKRRKKRLLVCISLEYFMREIFRFYRNRNAIIV
jgi:aspartyl-tRNA synthetase